MLDDESIDFFNYSDESQSSSISAAVRNSDIKGLMHILQERLKNPAPLVVDNRGWTALHIAASQSQNFNCLELLLRYGKSIFLDLDAETFEHETALFLACENNCPKNVSILLENGCASDIKKMDGTSPLHVAASNGNIDVVKILLKFNVDIDDQDWEGMTSLRIGVDKRIEKVCYTLLEHGASSTLSDMEGNSPLHSACEKGFSEIAKLLLGFHPCILNIQNKRGVTPFMFSVQSADLTSVNYLLSKRVDTSVHTIDGCIALHFAASLGNRQILEKVLLNTHKDAIETWCLNNCKNVFSCKSRIFHSLTCCVISSGSIECIRLILKSKLRKSILEAPHIENQNAILTVFSPLAFLFSTYIHCEDDLFTDILQLIIDRNIVYIDNFIKELSISWNSFKVELINPFSSEWIQAKGKKYSKSLIKHGISVDYCLKCYKLDLNFSEFGKPNHLDKYYGTLVEALCNDNDEVVEFYFMNSKVLEPSFVWNYMTEKLLSNHQRCPKKVCRLLASLIPIYCIGNAGRNEFHCCSKFNTPGEQITLSSLQQLCRKVIRRCLRFGTVMDNLNNFESRVQSLPLPKLLKDYLCFKGQIRTTWL